jgi:hypothetical protein
LESSRSDESSSVSSSKAVWLGVLAKMIRQKLVSVAGVGFVSPMKIWISPIGTTVTSRVFSSRHPEVIRWDDGEAGIVEDAPDGDGVADAYKGGSRLDPRSRRAMPHGGRQLSWFRQQICHRGRDMTVCGRG